ncbi:AcrR family transcriptional regulator [Bradyrhizobium sp. cir1]|uniref:TetR/AcrR family transcriptional regulator n=1 Tax=Bradyrhizobium sp. cir1 TaxID=1445730 RepID=UPI001606393D|nr:TetR/AcrR family transcriptional regulator [Bradyrhizobium sp. cir1]MBB4368375.1 AcrR family transcriptional regulator [Bradyrhizobium sp. cir1]
MTDHNQSTAELRPLKSKPVAGRAGRPPKEFAGEVDARILHAARKVFLQRGFEGASIDEIAEAAHSGKRSIYSRFPDKRALFTEVVTRDILTRIAESKAEPPVGATIEERLASVASTLLHWSFDADRIALMRLAIAEAHRFPELAAQVSRRARDLSTELGAQLLRNLTQSDELASMPAFAPERLPTTARAFLDVLVVPMILRALFEVDLKKLEPEIDLHVTSGVTFFLAACRNGEIQHEGR